MSNTNHEGRGVEQGCVIIATIVCISFLPTFIAFNFGLGYGFAAFVCECIGFVACAFFVVKSSEGEDD